MKIGVLAVQGSFREHPAVRAHLGVRPPHVVEAGPEVEVLAELDRQPVLLRQGRFPAAAFHPELADDTRVHELFVELVREEAHVRA